MEKNILKAFGFVLYISLSLFGLFWILRILLIGIFYTNAIYIIRMNDINELYFETILILLCISYVFSYSIKLVKKEISHQYE